MKRVHYFILYLFFFIPSISTNGQALACESFLEICDGVFVMELTEEVFNLQVDFVFFEDDVGMTFTIYPGGIDGVTSAYFLSPNDIGSSGTYFVTDLDTGNSCWGAYVSGSCSDYIVPPDNPDCENDFIFNGMITTCEQYNLSPLEYNIATFCIGDTTFLGVSSDKEDINAGYLEIFHPDRLTTISNGSIISYSDAGFTVVWDEVGEDCVILETTVSSTVGFPGNGIEYTKLTGLLAIIKPKTPLNILNDFSPEIIEVCIGEEVTLYSENDSENLRWRISNGDIFYGHKISLSLDIPGDYTVTLEDVTDCNCSEPDMYTIRVKPGETPGIQCIGTVCLGAEVSYYSEQLCDTYNWSVSAEGAIVDGGGVEDYFVTVLWSDGPVGQISLGTPGCLVAECKAVATIDIPIIADDATIAGPDTVCNRASHFYTAPAYEGTEFTWSIPSGNGYVQSGQNSNAAQVKWTNNNNNPVGIIQLDYENCNLDCSGSTQFEVLIVNNIDIVDLSLEACEYANINMRNTLGIGVSWSIEDPSGNVTDYPVSNSLMTTVTEPGDYTVTLYNQGENTCNFYDSRVVTVHENPSPPNAILGSDIICQDYYGIYNVDILEQYDQVFWTIYDGDTLVSTSNSNSEILYYTWQTSGPYKLNAQIINGLTGCISDASTRQWNDNYSLTSVDTVCLFSREVFKLKNIYEGDVTWQLEPSSAGKILYEQADSVVVLWQQYGDHQLIANYCNYTEIVNVHVSTYDPIISVEKACTGEFGSIQIDAPTGSTYSIEHSNGDAFSTGSNISRKKGKYKIVVTSKYGCTFEKNVEITEYSPFSVKIYSPPPFDPCEPFSEILSTNNLGAGYTYRWYRDNTLLSSATHQLTITQTGVYYLEVTDSNGCERSALKSVDCLGQGCPSTAINIVPPKIVDMDVIDVDCNHKEFEIIPPFESTDFNWWIDSLFFQSGGTSASYTFTEAGNYGIAAYGNGDCDTLWYINCADELNFDLICEEAYSQVTVPVVAYFDNLSSCVGQPMQFIDTSSILPGTTGLVYNWDFGDPTSGADNTSNLINPQHVFNDAEEHLVTLVISHPIGCTSTMVRTVSASAYPIIDISVSDQICLGFETFFEAISTDDNLVYTWDFGDTLLGVPSTSIGSHASFIYTEDSTFTVTLTAVNDAGCTTVITKEVEIVPNTINGEIVSDTDYPKCVGDQVVLTAVSNADNYLWSTGETTESITIVDPNNYTLTLTNDEGCEYYIDAHQVSDFVLGDATIFATTYDDIYGTEKQFFDSLTICFGESFTLQPTLINEVEYIWSNSSRDQLLNYNDNFKSLSPGTYTFDLTVRSIISGCEAILDPFVINIIALPTQPQISTPTPNLCEDVQHTLAVESPDPNMKYLWSTGDVGETVTVKAAGSYTVTAINQLGCEQVSDPVMINSLPPLSAWLSGCLETCFPKELCLRLDQELTYTLIANQSISTPITSTLSELNITEPGDYQLQVTNAEGCSRLSEMLTLTSAPDEHSLLGVVFFDHNENGIYDFGDELLSDIPVMLFSGNTLLYNDTTDLSGSYNFDTIDHSNLIAIIDPSSTGYTFNGDIDSFLIFNNCIDIKEVNFPLVPNCDLTEIDTIYQVCLGSSIEINGIVYEANETDTLVFPLSVNCDSIIRLSIEPYPQAVIDLAVDSTCMDTDDGVLFIDIINDVSIALTIDEDATIIESSTVTGLSAGDHILHIEHAHGCNQEIPFTIPEIASPLIDVWTTNSCNDTEGGALTLQVLAGEDLLFNIDDEIDFTEDLVFTNISTGEHTLYIRDVNGCDFSQGFTIGQFSLPTYNIDTEISCNVTEGGALYISDATDGVLFSLDGIDYLEIDQFNSLSAGNYMLYSLSADGCKDSLAFLIDEIEMPLISFYLENICEGFDNGFIEIDSSHSEYQFAVDGEAYTDQLVFDNLTPGLHTLYISVDDVCIYQEDFTILFLPQPDLILTQEGTCETVDEGTLTIEDNSEVEVLLSIDNINYTDQETFTELSTGAYILYAKTAEDCIYEYPFSIMEYALPQLDITSTNTCFGEEDGTITITSEMENLSLYLDDELVSDAQIANLSVGEYTVLVVDERGCDTSIEVIIGNFSELRVELPEIDQDCLFDPLLLEPIISSSHGAVSYLWSNGATSESVTVSESGELSVTIQDECNRFDHSWDLNFGLSRNADLIYVPNIFSPNNDGTNDCFISTLDTRVELVSYQQMIFDRWGNRMFTSNNIDDCWDGTFLSKQVASGVFVYITDMVVNNCNGLQEVRKIGDVTVIY